MTKAGRVGLTDILNLGACALSARIASGDLSPVDLMQATLARIQAVNPDLNAIVSLRDPDVLLAEAKAAERAPSRGWLHGIPVAVKDLVATEGLRTTSGSPLFADFVPAADDGLARRLRAAGAIIIGKTNVPEWGLGSHSVNPVHGPTRNPWDRSRSAGGSSGGAGVALAARMVAVADGSDMMGSLRNPAAWNNVYGFRPTAGLVPSDAKDLAILHRLSTDGPMARDVADLEALLATLSDGAYAPGEAPATPRIGWLGDWGGAYPMEAGILDLAGSAIARMQEIGWLVEDVAPPVPAELLWESWTHLRAHVTALKLGAHHAAHPEMLNAQAHHEVETGLRLTGADIVRAVALRQQWLDAAASLFETYDALLLPSTQLWPFPVETRWPTEIAGVEMDTYHRWMEVVVPASLGGLPALALPAGFGANGLPGGVQLIGPSGADGRILALGRAWHAATNWTAQRPPL
ncbi:amidase [Rhodobacterales bacterium HKCCE3408]|nr:amidase [Rhodobacterales bacterium HKCCE3408]